MQWFRCTVEKAGPAEDGIVYIAFTDNEGAFQSRWFSAVPPMQQEMLATALVALTSQLTVDVALTDSNEYGIIYRIYALKP